MIELWNALSQNQVAGLYTIVALCIFWVGVRYDKNNINNSYGDALSGWIIGSAFWLPALTIGVVVGGTMLAIIGVGELIKKAVNTDIF